MHIPIEDTDLLRRVETLADEIYRMARHWDSFDRDTVGKQLVRATDSVGANLVEGDGRRSDADSIRFFRYARSSAREARWWVNRVARRGIEPADRCDALRSELTECAKMVNGLIRYRSGLGAREIRRGYDDPFVIDEFPSPF